MGFLDKFRNLAQDAGLGEVATGIQSLESASGLVMPNELVNMMTLHKDLDAKVTALAATLSADPAQTNDLSGLRTMLMDQYRHLRSGGDPAPEPLVAARIKAMPQYHDLVSNFPTLQTKLAALEDQYLKCTFGYQLPDGTISVPDLSWSDEQWQQITEQSLHQTPRCWLVADRTQYAG